MAFIKKIIILNEVTKGYGRSELRGLATVERNGDKAVCRLTVFNLGDIKPGRFTFGIKSRNLRLQKFELHQSSQNFPLDKETDIEGVISCILAHSDTGGAVPLLWGSTDGKRIFEGNMTDGFTRPVPKAPEAPEEHQAREPLEEMKAPEEPKTPEKSGTDTGDTYAGEGKEEGNIGNAEGTEESETGERKEETADEIKKQTEAAAAPEERQGEIKAETVKGKKEEKKAEGKDKETAASEYEDYAVAAENFYPADYGESIPAAPQDSIDILNASLKGGKFYTAIKSQLDELFESYPKEEYLCSLLNGTDWVKVDYDNNGQYYTVGIITEDAAVKYICYGVPGKYAKTPPPELKGFCQWLPFDMEKPEADGYWMMYQDAETGKSVTLEMI